MGGCQGTGVSLKAQPVHRPMGEVGTLGPGTDWPQAGFSFWEEGKKLAPKGPKGCILGCPPGQENPRFSAHKTRRCCRWWPGWTHTPPGTTACTRSQWCCLRRLCRCCWCSRHRSSGPPLSLHSRTPRRRWSPGPADPRGKEGEQGVSPSSQDQAGWVSCRPGVLPLECSFQGSEKDVFRSYGGHMVLWALVSF